MDFLLAAKVDPSQATRGLTPLMSAALHGPAPPRDGPSEVDRHPACRTLLILCDMHAMDIY